MQKKISFPGDGIQTDFLDFMKESPSENNEEIYRQASEQQDVDTNPYDPFLYWN